MSSADLRYPRPTIMADYARAGIGVLLCGAPLLLLEVNYWLAALLGAGFALFALFLVRTALRHRTRYVLGPDTLCADGPAGTLVEWSRLDRMKLSYFSTKRDRSDGWMQLAIGSPFIGTLVRHLEQAFGFPVSAMANKAVLAGVEYLCAYGAALGGER